MTVCRIHGVEHQAQQEDETSHCYMSGDEKDQVIQELAAQLDQVAAELRDGGHQHSDQCIIDAREINLDLGKALGGTAVVRAVIDGLAVAYTALPRWYLPGVREVQKILGKQFNETGGTPIDRFNNLVRERTEQLRRK